jgi:hypothetical protein
MRFCGMGVGDGGEVVGLRFTLLLSPYSCRSCRFANFAITLVYSIFLMMEDL